MKPLTICNKWVCSHERNPTQYALDASPQEARRSKVSRLAPVIQTVRRQKNRMKIQKISFYEIGVQCVCGEKLSACLVDDDKYDFLVVVDNTHICPAAEHTLADGLCPSCRGTGEGGEIGLRHECLTCDGTGKAAKA